MNLEHVCVENSATNADRYRNAFVIQRDIPVERDKVVARRLALSY